MMIERKKYPLSKIIIFSLLATALFFLFLEGIARLLPPVKYVTQAAIFMGDREGIFIEDPLLMWRMKPHMKKKQRTNSGGFRGAEFPKKKSDGEFRIVLLGDSMTWGWGVPDEAVYAVKLKEFLSERVDSRPVVIINGGVPGYTSYQGKLLFSTELKKYKPDLVITYFGVNDMYAGASVPPDRSRNATPMPLVKIVRMLRRSKLYSDARKAVLRQSAKRELENDRKEKEIGVRVPPGDFIENLAAIEKEAGEVGGDMLNIIPAWNIKGVIRNDLVVMVFKEKSTYIRYTDAAPLYQYEPSFDLKPLLEASGLSADTLFADYCHLSPEGHRILAEGLADYIIGKALIK